MATNFDLKFSNTFYQDFSNIISYFKIMCPRKHFV